MPMKYTTAQDHDHSPSWRWRRYESRFSAASAEIADKRNIVDDKRVDLVIHIDSSAAGRRHRREGRQYEVSPTTGKYGNSSTADSRLLQARSEAQA